MTRKLESEASWANYALTGQLTDEELSRLHQALAEEIEKAEEAIRGAKHQLGRVVARMSVNRDEKPRVAIGHDAGL